MSLILIGTGIAFDLTQSAMEALKQCDKIYWEGYTGLIPKERIAELGRELGKEPIQLKREQVESRFLVNEAKTAPIALLTSGDPLTATTHIALILEAEKADIATRIIPNSSIYTAAPGKAGLQIYRFGKTVSLVNLRPGYAPQSAFEGIRQNLKNNLHTLILLDTEPQPMEAKTALGMLERVRVDKVVVLSRLGAADERIRYGTISLLKEQELGEAPFCIIAHAQLHPLEEEALERWQP